jgi:formylglycine-generating enzyme required for sulfatase activity
MDTGVTPEGPTLLLGARAVRRLGVGLLAAGLLLPWLILAWRAAEPPLPGDLKGPVTLRPELVALPAGSFRMGSPLEEKDRDNDEVLHEVRISRPFLIARTEVTQGQFAAVMGEGALHRGDDWSGRSCRNAGVGPDLPAVCVTWQEAVAFCNRLSELEGLKPVYEIQGDQVIWPKGQGKEADGYRLPTEAEWEYAARAGRDGAVYEWGSSIRPFVEGEAGANVADESGGKAHPEWSIFDGYDDGFVETSPVGSFPANGFGLQDMAGNVWEWCSDWHDPDGFQARPAVDPEGPAAGRAHVRRGGSWNDGPNALRLSNRPVRTEDRYRDNNVGFRCARDSRPASVPSRTGAAD